MMPGRGSVTQYGFDWGPMEVTRMAHIPGRGYALEIRTASRSMQLYVSEAGRVIKACEVRKLPPPSPSGVAERSPQA